MSWRRKDSDIVPVGEDDIKYCVKILLFFLARELLSVALYARLVASPSMRQIHGDCALETQWRGPTA
jgi:hypothetical protein